VLEQMLVGMGARSVSVASNGREAIRMLQNPEMPVDIVISDLLMPDVDGIELLPALARVVPPVSLILASADEQSLRVAYEIAKGQGIRVLGTISKPITPGKLLPLLAALRSGIS
jgi:CheY-like chemotaxis protein